MTGGIVPIPNWISGAVQHDAEGLESLHGVRLMASALERAKILVRGHECRWSPGSAISLRALGKQKQPAKDGIRKPLMKRRGFSQEVATPVCEVLLIVVRSSVRKADALDRYGEDEAVLFGCKTHVDLFRSYTSRELAFSPSRTFRLTAREAECPERSRHRQCNFIGESFCVVFCLLSKICGELPAPVGHQGCDRARFPSPDRSGIRTRFWS